MTALLCALLSAAPADARPRVYERVVATVDTEVVTLSRLQFEARVELVLAAMRHVADGAPGPGALSLQEIPHQDLKKALAHAISTRLAAKEAARLGAEPDPSAVDAALTEFARGLAPLKLDQFLALNEVSANDFERLIRRDVLANGYLENRGQLRAPVSDAEVDAFLARNQAKLTSKPSAELREEIRAGLAKQRNNALVLAEEKRLYARAKVRIVDPAFADADADLRPAPGG